MPQWFRSESLADPIGPGSVAWNAFDMYVEAQRKAPNDYKASMRKHRMIRELRKQGRGDLANAWCDMAIERAKELIEE